MEAPTDGGRGYGGHDCPSEGVTTDPSQQVVVGRAGQDCPSEGVMTEPSQQVVVGRAGQAPGLKYGS